MSYQQQLVNSIDEFISNISLNELKKINAKLSTKYKLNLLKKELTQEEKIAYIVSRMPATCTVIYDVVSQLKEFKLKSYLDLGAGPATSAFALFSLFNIEQATLVENDKGFIEIGNKLLDKTDFKDKVIWKNREILSDFDWSGSDMILLSYVINELSLNSFPQIIHKWIQSDARFLVIIEPGTKEGFSNIHFLRHELISQNKYIVAPCTHLLKCPIVNNDWCHFSSRVNRSKAHRLIKDASLNYEDEKYSYLIASKEKPNEMGSRVLRHPLKKTNQVILTVCTNQGEIKKEIISKKDKERYKRARKIKWGGHFE